MSYLKFLTEEECQGACDFIFNKMLEEANTILNGGIVGNKNGVPNSNAAKTTAWDVPLNVDGSYYIHKPNDDIVSAMTSAGYEITEEDPPENEQDNA